MSIEQRIVNRRNVKPQHFNGELLSDNLIMDVLSAANWAPTHGYTEPWRFVVFSGDARKNLATFQAEAYKDISAKDEFLEAKYQKLLATPLLASHIVAVVSKNSKSKIPFIEEIVATACAVQNILLLAAENKVAVHWTSGGMTYTDEMKEFLGFSTEDQVLGFLYMGKCNERINQEGRRLSAIDDKINWVK